MRPSLCSVLGARKETVNTYLDILSRLGIIHRLGAWTASGARKEVGSSKLHFMDTGCTTALRGEDAASFGLRADPNTAQIEPTGTAYNKRCGRPTRISIV
jgi:uncharacterized protein